VQGPPGTGKSHTIANVITHLLAQGKKVLVTAKTDQALRALQEHVPPAFHDLMIYFLKGADKSGAELVRSVSRLQDLVENHDRSRMARMATDHHAELKDLRRNRADLQNRIQELRDADVRPTNLNAGYLDQSLADHVTCVLADAPRYEWLKAEEGTDLGEQLSAVASLSDWIERFANGPVRQFNPSARVMLDVPLMPKPIRITELKKKERELEINFPAGTWIIDSTMTDDEIRQRLEEFFSAPVLLARLGWQRALKQDLEQGNDTGWKRRKTTTEEFVKVLSQAEVVSLYQDVEFDIPPGISPKKLRADVLEVGNYRRSGKALTGLMSKFQLTRAVKDREYIYQACTLNGHPATTAVELEKLYHHANVCCALDELDAAWHKYPTESGRTSDKREEYIDRLLQLKEAMYSYPFYERARAQVQEMVGQAAAELEAPDATARLRTAQLAHVARSAVNKIARELRMAESYLSRFAPSDKASKELLDALQRRDAEAYAKGLDDFRELAAMNRLHGELKSAKTRAERVFSATVEAWMLTPGNDLPSKEEITSAIYWRNASEQLIGRFDESVDGLFGQIRRNEKRFREVALEYVRIRATASFVEGLENESAFNSTLVRWMQAAKSSAGRGKKAFKARIAAKEKLREISSDIPCWIMPLYRLADTLTPEPELFDVVIIDEASQLGPEAIFLQYITKKIIVVGDDQQTAPEEVGVEEDKVQGLIRAHLGDIRDRQYYGTNYTFFDHAAANAGRRITLREHFRCMPEIIGFSNELCYAPLGTALIPLKQFRGDRLPPLKTQFISNGTFYRDVNEPEAEAIVSRIQAIMADPLYAGKTIGVITLQGNNQHVVIKSLLDAAAQSKGFSEESKTRRLVVGKPADFQGDERDIILLSLVTALDHRRNSVSGANYKRRYNVAMSRAKEQVILFHSVQLDDLKPNDLRYKLLHYFTKRSLGESLGVEVIPSGPLDVPPGQPFDSWFEVDVYRDLTEKGYLVQPQYPVGSYRIDLVVHLENGSRVAVECDGDFWHGPEHIEQDTIRQLQLERSGWEFYRIRYSQYKYDKASALDALWDLLKEREKLVVPKIVKSTHKGSELEEITADTRSYILQGTEETASVKPELPITAVIVDEAWGEMVEDRNKSAIGIPSDQPVQAVKSDVASDNNTPPHSPITGKPGDEWLIFTDGANVIKYKIGMNSLPNLLGEEKDIYRVSAISPYRFMIFAFENGRVDKVEMRAFGTSRSRVKNAYNEDAALIFIAGFREDTDLAAIATNNKVVVFSTSTLGLHSSRANKGNLVFKRGSEVSEVKLLSETNFVDDDFYRRSTLNVTGYYLKEDDSF
jgi:very-short-patch-repair endonuclease